MLQELKPRVRLAVKRGAVSAAFLFAVSDAAVAQDAWTFSATPQATTGRYAGSTTRNKVGTAALQVDAQYLERGGLSANVGHTKLSYNNGAADLVQNNGFLSGYLNFTPDRSGGRVVTRADVYRLNNNDPTNETDGVSIFAPQVSFRSFNNAAYFDLGMAFSRYGNSNVAGRGDLRVRQTNPTLGFAFNNRSNLLQLRVYDERYSNSIRANNRTKTDALEVKLTQYLQPLGWSPELVTFGVLAGRRMYGVDPDSAVAYNLADMQKSSYSLLGQWKLSQAVRLIASGSIERYETLAAGSAVSYTGSYFYGGLRVSW